MPDPLFQPLFEEMDPMSWAPTHVVRDRARRRARRTRVAAVGAAVVAVGVAFAGVAVAQREPGPGPGPATSGSATEPMPDVHPPPDSTRSPSASSTAPASPPASTAPEGTAIVDTLFLQPGDVGSGYRVVSGAGGSGDWTFEFTASILGCQPAGPNPPDRVATRDRTLSRGTPPAEDILAQYVARYRPGDAGRYLDQVRARVNACGPGNGRSITLAAEHFAGEDALLIEVNYGEGFTTKHVLVRQGDLLTEFFTKPERDTAAAEGLARTAALRLCRGTPVC